MKSLLLALLTTFSCYVVIGNPIDDRTQLNSELKVSKLPELEIITKVLNFDTVNLGTQKVMQIEVRSRGYSTVSIYGFLISQERDNFIMSDTATDFKPITVRSDKRTFEVTFKPTAPIDYYSEVYIQCDAHGVVPIKLIAVGNWDPLANISDFPQTDELKLNIQPNGDNIEFTIQSNISLKVGKLDVYSTDGMIIRSFKVNRNSNNLHFNINKNELPPLSIISFTHGEKVYMYKYMRE